MKALRNPRRFVLVKCNSEEQHEIREYVQENLYELARDFCVSTSTLVAALENVQDDAALAVRLLETIRRAEAPSRLASLKANRIVRCPQCGATTEVTGDGLNKAVSSLDRLDQALKNLGR